MPSLKTILYIIISLLFSNSIIAQSNDKVTIMIVQQVLPDGISHVYKVRNKNVKVFRVTKRGIKIPLTCRRLKSIQYDSLIFYSKKIMDENFNSTYSGGGLDGVNWQLKLRLNKRVTELYIDNFYMPVIDDLMNTINSSLPKRDRYIQMDWFGMKKRYYDKQK